jgi:hypothetical protein
MHVCTLHKLENVYLMHLEGFIELKHDENEDEVVVGANYTRIESQGSTMNFPSMHT